MHAVVMACVCRACKREREGGRAQANMQIFYRTAAVSRPRSLPPKLRNYGILEQQPGYPWRASGNETEAEAGSSRGRPNRSARRPTTGSHKTLVSRF